MACKFDILILYDSNFNEGYKGAFLSSLRKSCDIEKVESLDDAMGKLNEKGYDVILSDVNLPYNSLNEMIVLLKSKSHGQPIYLFSSNGKPDTENIKRALELNDNVYFYDDLIVLVSELEEQQMYASKSF